MKLLTINKLPYKKIMLSVMSFILMMLLVVFCIKALKVGVNNDFICHADMTTVNDDMTFHGVMDFKYRGGKGISNISGYVSVASDKEYIIQRTVLFTLENYGDNPVLSTEKIIISNLENTPGPILEKVLPALYLNEGNVTDAEVVHLRNNDWLIIKSKIPYLYCNT
jgi:hypothetical protein